MELELFEGRLVRRKVAVQAAEVMVWRPGGTADAEIVIVWAYLAGSRLRCVALAVVLGGRWDRRTPRHGGPRMMGCRLRGYKLPSSV